MPRGRERGKGWETGWEMAREKVREREKGRGEARETGWEMARERERGWATGWGRGSARARATAGWPTPAAFGRRGGPGRPAGPAAAWSTRTRPSSCRPARSGRPAAWGERVQVSRQPSTAAQAQAQVQTQAQAQATLRREGSSKGCCTSLKPPSWWQHRPPARPPAACAPARPARPPAHLVWQPRRVHRQHRLQVGGPGGEAGLAVGVGRRVAAPGPRLVGLPPGAVQLPQRRGRLGVAGLQGQGRVRAAAVRGGRQESF